MEWFVAGAVAGAVLILVVSVAGLNLQMACWATGVRIPSLGRSTAVVVFALLSQIVVLAMGLSIAMLASHRLREGNVEQLAGFVSGPGFVMLWNAFGLLVAAAVVARLLWLRYEQGLWIAGMAYMMTILAPLLLWLATPRILNLG